MRKLKEVLRMHHEVGLGTRQIARSLGIAPSTVHEYIDRFQTAQLNWPPPEDWDDQRLEAALSPPKKPVPRAGDQPDFAHIQRELQQHRHLTLQLLWEEYRRENSSGYSYSRFCLLYRQWHQRQDVCLRQEHRAGEKMFVDWAGATIPIHNRRNADVQPAALFVAVLGASSYSYAEAAENQQMEAWLTMHIHAFEFFGGVPKLLVIDNTKTGVTRACRYDPDLNPTFQELAAHYGCGVLAARPYKPRDKAKVEVAVQVVQRWIVAALRHRKLYSVAEANQAIRELLEKLNQRPFRKRPGSRAALFAELDKPALQPLPAEPYDLSQWSHARVNIDYHIAFDSNFYSVPSTMVGQSVEVRSTPTTIEIFRQGHRVASHLRSRGQHCAVTNPEHRPKSHQAHLDWPPSRMVSWAQKIGPETARLFEQILARWPHPEMGYRSCLGIIRLAEKYGSERMEATAARALAAGTCRYQSVRSILEKGLDRQPLSEPKPQPAPRHDNLRGAEYFQ
jgi:transposase